MRGMVIKAAVVTGWALWLAGCAIADSHAPLPAFMRIKAAEPPPPEALPDVAQLVREKMDAVFVASSNPRQVRVAPPHHAPNRPGWTACVRAEVSSATGRPIGTQTYRIAIDEGGISDRRRAEDGDNCESEEYRPI